MKTTKTSSLATSQPLAHHYIRTMFAGLFGTVALSLVLASILLVWANRTLTDTATFTQTVAPLVTQPAVQEFVAAKLTDQLLQSAPVAEVAASLLPADQVAGKTPEQLTPAVRAEIGKSVTQVLGSPRVVALWKSTSKSQHAEIIRQLDAGAPQVTLDVEPLVTEAVAELKQTELAPLANQIELKPGMAKVDLKGSLIEQVRTYYRDLKTATLVIVLVTLMSAGLAVWISVHHLKTLRRVLMGTAVIAFLTAAVIAAPTVVPVGDAATQHLVAALAATLLHNLQVACLVIGGVGVVAAIGSKVYEARRR
jgi:hypothetical protein